MAREIQRISITKFLGLGTNGEAASRPIRQTPDGFGLFWKDCENLHAPQGKLTNKDIGYSLEKDNSVVGVNNFGLGGIWYRDDKSAVTASHMLAMFQTVTPSLGGRLYAATGLDDAWVEVDPSRTFAQAWYDFLMYDEKALFCESSVSPYYYANEGGSPVIRDWFITAPSAPGTPVATDPGTLTLGAGWKYIYFYKRADKSWSSPASLESPIVGNVSSFDHVVLPLSANVADGVDEIDIYRTTDGGSVFRYLATIGSSSTSYNDSTPDDDLSLSEAPTLVALDSNRFGMMRRVGDRVYFADIKSEGGDNVARPNRIRWTYPGQPWRVDVLDYTDEIPNTVIAIEEVGGGLMAFTADSSYFVNHIGNGVHRVDPADMPGASSKKSVCKLRDGIAWMDAHGIYVASTRHQNVTNRAGFLDITDQLTGASVEEIVGTAGFTGVNWISLHPSNDYVCAALQTAGQTPNTLLLFDRKRRSWWRVNYNLNNPLIPILAPRPGSGDINLLELYALCLSGDTIRMFNGETANTTGSLLQPLVPTAESNPIDMQLPQQKRFRYVDTFVELLADLDLKMEWFLDGDRLNKLEQRGLNSPGDVLDSTFVLDESELTGAAFFQNRFKVGQKGDYLSFVVGEVNGVDEISIPRIDLYFQESPRRSP